MYSLFLSWGHVKNNTQCALHRLLSEDKSACTQAAIMEQIQRFGAAPWQRLNALPTHTGNTRGSMVFLSASRQFTNFWKISSFSGLHQSNENPYPSPAADEAQMYAELEPSPYKGAAFGNAMHYVLEHAQTIDWRGSTISAPNTTAKQLAYSALIQFGFEAESAENGIMPLCTLVHNTLHGLLPEGICLLNVSANDVRHEMEFHLRITHARCADVLDILHQHGYCLGRKQLGFMPHLHGLLTGKIDLLFCHQQRFYIVDYKSNLLADYSQATLTESIKAQEYDLQYVLYCLALHRFLAQKLGTEYDYQKHMGGVRYLYARGMQANTDSGIFCDLPAFSMIKQLDLCFDASRGDSYVA
jgi:exodeoxyribonuclease V beta subunit